MCSNCQFGSSDVGDGSNSSRGQQQGGEVEQAVRHLPKSAFGCIAIVEREEILAVWTDCRAEKRTEM